MIVASEPIALSLSTHKVFDDENEVVSLYSNSSFREAILSTPLIVICVNFFFCQRRRSERITINMASLKTFLIVSILVGTAFAETGETLTDKDVKNSTTVEEDQPTFGVVDLVVLVALGVGGIYYFFLRKKSEDPRVSQYVIQPTTVPASPAGSTEKGFLAKMKNSKRRMVVFYGSQTG